MSDGQAKIWEYFQNQAPESFAGSVARCEFLLRHVSRGQRVLNVGVGGGQLETMAVRRNVDIHTLDPSGTAIDRIREHLRMGERARVGTLQSIPWSDEFFDAVIASEVLEHLSDTSLAEGLGEIRRVLRPGGCLIGTVPAAEDLSASQVVCPDCGKLFHRWGHLQSFDELTLRRRLEEGRLRPTLLKRRRFISWPTLNWKGKVAGAAQMLLATLGQHGTGENLVFIARNGP